MHTEKEIILCESCKGSGKRECSERYDYHHRLDWEWDEPCTKCGGLGRVLKIVTTSIEMLTEEDLKLRPKPEDAG